MTAWKRIEDIVNSETDSIRLKSYIERYYSSTKITKITLLKIMEFYIHEA